MKFYEEPANIPDEDKGGRRRLNLPSSWTIAERLRNGETHIDLADEYGISAYSLSSWLNKKGWTVTGVSIGSEKRERPGPMFSFEPQRWMDDAACATIGGDMWFAAEPGDRALAIELCMECPVRLRCLEYALDCDAKAYGGAIGIWGGLTAGQRSNLAKGKAAIDDPPAKIPGIERNLVAQCGTDGGYHKHLRRSKTKPCDACKEAHTEAQRMRLAKGVA